MGGFESNFLKKILLQKYVNEITLILVSASARMQEEQKGLPNNENKITYLLVEKYLKVEAKERALECQTQPFLFQAETPENFDEKENAYVGRADIKVTNWCSLEQKEDFIHFLIECKRLSQGNSLKRKYVTEGIARFVVEPEKYLSPNNANFMLGYIVQNGSVKKQVDGINSIQKEELILPETCDLRANKCFSPGNVYESLYRKSQGELLLRHIFLDLSALTT